jgi:DNA primase
VNIGCIGLHLWPYLADDPEHADELRIDLDPTKGIGFEEVRAAALRCRDLLSELGLRSFPKTTGSNGLHIYLRLEARWDSFAVRAAAVALARELERRHPEEITANWWKEERGTRVFVDFNQNAPHKTVFGAWFARPRTGGQVSTPLSWDEVEAVVPDDLTIRSVPELVRRRGDPWADIAAAPQSLEPLLALAERDRAAGLHDAPWPPQYPKMPDEPPRVAPSRAKKA